MAVERTVNPYRTYGPAGELGEDWGEYFRRVKRVRHDERDADELSAELPPELRDSGVWPDDQHQPSSLVAFNKALIRAGFETRGVFRTTFEKGQPYGEGAKKAGQSHPDRTVTTIAFAGVKPGYGYCRLEFEQVNGGSWKATWRQINGQYRPVSDKELKGWISDATHE